MLLTAQPSGGGTANPPQFYRRRKMQPASRSAPACGIPSLLDHALAAVARGWSVFPCTPRQKTPQGSLAPNGFKNASCDPALIKRWWAQIPACNPAIACGASNLLVIDVDEGLSSWEHAREWMLRNGLPPTYAVRTGRRTSYGAQLYYSGAVATTYFELDGCSGQIKSTGGYVMAAGSIHPDSGERYIVVCDQGLASLPIAAYSKLTAVSKRKNLRLEAGEKVKPGGRHEYLLKQASSLRNNPVMRNSAVLLATLRAINLEDCDPPIDIHSRVGELEAIVDYVLTHDRPDPLMSAFQDERGYIR
jgi:Bifunctional DNA primase/polymerase, N-terminal